jgi:hypothetical protein
VLAITTRAKLKASLRVRRSSRASYLIFTA